MAKEGLMSLAKRNKNETIAKKIEKKKDEKPISSAEERDIKAKATVAELLKDVPLTFEKQEKLIELEANDSNDNVKSKEWLEEQIQLLVDSNQNLKAELELAKGDYQRIFAEYQKLKQDNNIGSNDGQVAQNVIRVFNELQGNYFQYQQNFIIYPVAFMNRLIMYFPFLQNEKRF
jgi:thiamine pyrophosphate-dependent acetolactate synthase large subunit-like protein